MALAGPTLPVIDAMPPQERIRFLENHIRVMQEQLEYTLLHLDSTNFSEDIATGSVTEVDGGEWE